MPHRCSERDILAFIHGDLPPGKEIALRWHLRHCPACQARLQKFSSLSGALSIALASPVGRRWLRPLTLGAIGLRTWLLIAILAGGAIGLFSLQAQAHTPEPTGLSSTNINCPSNRGPIPLPTKKPQTAAICREPTATHAITHN